MDFCRTSLRLPPKVHMGLRGICIGFLIPWHWGWSWFAWDAWCLQCSFSIRLKKILWPWLWLLSFLIFSSSWIILGRCLKKCFVTNWNVNMYFRCDITFCQSTGWPSLFRAFIQISRDAHNFLNSSMLKKAFFPFFLCTWWMLRSRRLDLSACLGKFPQNSRISSFCCCFSDMHAGSGKMDTRPKQAQEDEEDRLSLPSCQEGQVNTITLHRISRSFFLAFY